MAQTDPAFGDDRTAVDRVTTLMAGFGRLGVAFSGGVDSSTLLALAVRALGPDRVIALLGVSPSLADDERAAAHGGFSRAVPSIAACRTDRSGRRGLDREETRPMSRPSLPDPTAVARGAELIKQELLRSMIMPRPAAALRGDHAAARLRARCAFPASRRAGPVRRRSRGRDQVWSTATGACWPSWVPGERRDGHGDRGRPALPDPAFSGSSVPDTITERFDGIWAADAPVPAGRAVGHGAARG